MGASKILALSFVTAVAFICTPCVANLINSNVKRIIDGSGPIAITRTAVTLKNTGEADVAHFTLSIHPSQANRVHDIWVTDASSSDLKALPLTAVSESENILNGGKDFRVTLPAPLKGGAEVTVDIRLDVSGSIVAVPAEISGHDSQYVRYTGSAYFFSPYMTERMETSIVLGSSSITSKSELPSPSSVSGKRVTLGAYTGVAAYSWQQVSMRFKNDRGFLIAKRANKEVSVTHWSTISVMEEFEVRNGAARHMGEWSRLDHSHRYESPYRTAIGDVWANLPADATNVVYRDLIGNITTSRLRRATKDKRAVQLTFRYPLMGGWHNHFWYTYTLEHERHAKAVDGATHEVRVPVWPSLHGDMWCEELVLKVVLPEWADDVDVLPHRSIAFDVTQGSERTSLALLGRRVVTLRAKMIRSKSKHTNEVVIRYRYNGTMRWVSPMVYSLSSLFFIIVSLSFLRSGLESAGLSSSLGETVKVKSS